MYTWLIFCLLNPHNYLLGKEEEKSPFPLAGLIFPLTELLHATNQKDEANLLGRGGYGTVYKGTLRHTTVAVKFLNEVAIYRAQCTV